MKSAILVAMVLAGAGALTGHSAQDDSARTGALTRPNIVVFLVDDMGWQDTSVPFHTEVTPLNRRYRTPNMERLAAAGVKFTNAYAHAVCSPTRVSLMTGLNPARHRVTNWTLERDTSTDARHPALDPVAWNVNGLSPEPGIAHSVHARALPDYLREAGYVTIHAGKAHFGAKETPAADPLNIGFDVNVAGHAAGAPGSYSGVDHFATGRRQGNPAKDSVWDVPGLAKYHGQNISLTEATTIEALAAVDKAIDAGKPFFLYLSHYAVHTPIMPDARFIEHYEDRDPTEAAYASMVEAMDRSLGDVLDDFERRGVAKNTAVFFLSDNGGLTHAARGGPRLTHNAPLSAGKGSAREGGIRVPMLASWPGVTRPGSVSGAAVIVEDLFATVLAVAGVGEVEQVGGAIDGVSFAAALRGEPVAGASERALIWHTPNNWAGDFDPGYGPHSSVRVGPWKLIYYHTPGREPRFELFNVVEDVGETDNRAATETERVRVLAERLEQELRRRDAQMPTVRETGEAVAWPAEFLLTSRLPKP